jgi:hypothetical protein
VLVPDSDIVFFVHVMKTGGTTVLQSLRRTYPAEARYPEGGIDSLISSKGSPEALFDLDAQRREGLRFIAPHVPLSAALQFQREAQRNVNITLVLRDGLDRAVSHLRQVARRFDYAYSYRELLDLPLLGNFFLSNHQVRALTAGVNDWPLWEACFSALGMLESYLDGEVKSFSVAPVPERALPVAIASLGALDVLGLQGDFDNWWQRCHRRYGWPQAPIADANVGAAQEPAQAPSISVSILDELRERNRLDTQLYAAARKLQQAS